jgi:hypothetical protein
VQRSGTGDQPFGGSAPAEAMIARWARRQASRQQRSDGEAAAGIELPTFGPPTAPFGSGGTSRSFAFKGKGRGVGGRHRRLWVPALMVTLYKVNVRKRAGGSTLGTLWKMGSLELHWLAKAEIFSQSRQADRAMSHLRARGFALYGA